MHRKILGTDRLKSPLGTAFPRDFITFRFGKQDKDSKYLDGQYAAFGHIVDGIDVLDMIASVPTNKRDDSPRTPVVIEKAWVEDEPIGDFPKIR